MGAFETGNYELGGETNYGHIDIHNNSYSLHARGIESGFAPHLNGLHHPFCYSIIHFFLLFYKPFLFTL